jgi:hypothetical protein
VVDRCLNWLGDRPGAWLSEWLEHKEGVGWWLRSTGSRSRGRGRSWSWCWNWSWSWCGCWSRSRSRSCCSWSRRLSRSLRSVDLDLSNVGDVERLEVKLDGSGRDYSSGPGCRSGGGGCQGLQGGPHWLGGPGSCSGHHGSCSGPGWSCSILQVELDSALNILLESGLEGPAVLVE